ncbi:MAG: hypothetical protein ACOCVR_00470, partial [Myxococcota bacterium]
RVGEIEKVDRGSETTHLVTDQLNPEPRLVFSGRREDLELLRKKRPPLDRVSTAGAIWRDGGGLVVRMLGYAGMFAMASMLGLRALRSRARKVAASEASQERVDAGTRSTAGGDVDE